MTEHNVLYCITGIRELRLKRITVKRGSDRIATGEEMENFRSSKAITPLSALSQSEGYDEVVVTPRWGGGNHSHNGRRKYFETVKTTPIS